MDEATFAAIVEPLARPLRRRTTLYGRVRDDVPVPMASSNRFD